MTVSILKSLLALLLFAGVSGAQQGVRTVSSLERLAVDTAVKRAVRTMTPGLRIVIDPMIVRANQAPGYRDSTLREPSRNQYLVESFHARTLPRDSVFDCSSRPCTMRNADVLVTLSEPAIVGDKATVTVTTSVPVHGSSSRQLPITMQYRTVIVHLEKSGAAWRVVSLDDLGIS